MHYFCENCGHHFNKPSRDEHTHEKECPYCGAASYVADSQHLLEYVCHKCGYVFRHPDTGYNSDVQICPRCGSCDFDASTESYDTD